MQVEVCRLDQNGRNGRDTAVSDVVIGPDLLLIGMDRTELVMNSYQ